MNLTEEHRWKRANGWRQIAAEEMPGDSAPRVFAEGEYSDSVNAYYDQTSDAQWWTKKAGGNPR